MPTAIATAVAWMRRRAENIVAGLLGLMFVAFIIQIVFRYFFNFPVGWTSELSVVTWLYMVLIGSAFWLKETEEVRFDIISARLGPKGRRAIGLVVAISAVILFGMSYALQRGDNVRVDVFYADFGPRSKFVVDIVSGLLTLLLALAFPLAYGGWDLLRQRKLNLMASIGVVSTLLTGGIGLLALDAQWLAVKEAAVPGAIGLAVLISARTRYPLVRVLVFNPALFDVDAVHTALRLRGNEAEFERRLRAGTVMLAGTFLFSAVANYLLASRVVIRTGLS